MSLERYENWGDERTLEQLCFHAAEAADALTSELRRVCLAAESVIDAEVERLSRGKAG